MKRAGLACLLLTLLTGCVHSNRERARAVLHNENSHLLYFQPEPHPSLYVEVDAVEGAEFSETELSALETILRQWSEKPAGVFVVQSSAIPRSAARGHSANSLARRYMDGPTVATNQPPPAYIYVLVYDNRVNRNAVHSPRGASQWPVRDTVPPMLARPEEPHIITSPYRAMIYMDRSWLGGLLPKTYWRQTLIHEAGHVLGLVNREIRTEGHHCPTKWCVMGGRMSEKIRSDMMRWLKREKPKPNLCVPCAAELRQFQRSVDAKITTRFAGPVLVRRMPSYQVLSLPGFCGLYIVDSIDEEVPRFLLEFRKLPGQTEVRLTARASGQQGTESVLQAIAAAKKDVDPAVRAAARLLENRFRESRSETEKIIADPGGAASGSQSPGTEKNGPSSAARSRR
jgi:hypothetical protein